jgi:hypothetical protein
MVKGITVRVAPVSSLLYQLDALRGGEKYYVTAKNDVFKVDNMKKGLLTKVCSSTALGSLVRSLPPVDSVKWKISATDTEGAYTFSPAD